jgi:hypothetical protein
MEFSWTTLWTTSNRLTHKMGEKNVDVRETDLRVVEEHWLKILYSGG